MSKEMRKGNYDKRPAIPADGLLWKGWDAIAGKLAGEVSAGGKTFVLVVECYHGVYMVDNKLKYHEELFHRS
jgi:hypothetical protein